MKNKKYIFNFSTFLAIFIFVFAFWGITDSSDWAGYEYWFSEQKSSDILFNYLSGKFISFGYKFRALYRLHIVLISLSFVYLFSICRVNKILFTLIVLLFFYVEIGNQIRYYLAFPLTYIAYYYYLKKRYYFSSAFIIIAILSHFGSLVIACSLLIFSQLYRSKSLFKYIVLLSIFTYLLYFTGTNLDSRFNSYYHGTASIIGGIYLVIPPLISFSLIFRMHNNVSHVLKHETLYKYLFTSSIATSFLCLTAIQVLVIESRYLEPCLIFWLAYFIYIKRKNKSINLKKKCINNISIIFLLYFSYRFIFPYIFIESEYVRKAMYMLSSYSLG